MNYYEYENFYHFTNSIKKCFRTTHNTNIKFSRKPIQYLKQVYNLYETYKDILRKENIKYPTDVVFETINFCSNVDDLINEFTKILEEIINDYSNLPENIEFLKVNYYKPSQIKNKLTEIQEYSELNISDEVRKILYEIENKPGIYKLFNEKQKLIYIGKSINLAGRIISSAQERNAYYFSYALTKNGNTASIYEPYLIGKDQPQLNSEYTGEGQANLKLPKLNFTSKFKIRSD